MGGKGTSTYRYRASWGISVRLGCTELGKPYKTVERQFADRDEVICWVIETQLGQRNLSPIDAADLRAIYAEKVEKRQGERVDLTCGQIVHKSEPDKTRDQIGEKFRVTGRTISRNIALHHNLETIKESVGPEVVKKIKSREIKPSRATIAEAAKVAEKEPERAREILKHFTCPQSVTRFMPDTELVASYTP